MRLAPAAAELPLLYSLNSQQVFGWSCEFGRYSMKNLFYFFLIFFGWSSLVNAQVEQRNDLLFEGNYLARIGNNSPEEIERALVRIEQYFLADQPEGDYDPVVIVLHGPEVGIFLRSQYQEHKHLVDLAARLTAFEVVDIRVCETSMGVLGRPVNELVPFVNTVPFGPAEVNRLISEEQYLYF